MKRYDLRGSCGKDQGGIVKTESDSGYWVKFTDFEQAIKEERARCAAIVHSLAVSQEFTDEQASLLYGAQYEVQWPNAEVRGCATEKGKSDERTL